MDSPNTVSSQESTFDDVPYADAFTPIPSFRGLTEDNEYEGHTSFIVGPGAEEDDNTYAWMHDMITLGQPLAHNFRDGLYGQRAAEELVADARRQELWANQLDDSEFFGRRAAAAWTARALRDHRRYDGWRDDNMLTQTMFDFNRRIGFNMLDPETERVSPLGMEGAFDPIVEDEPRAGGRPAIIGHFP